jgi:hypothetical protein
MATWYTTLYKAQKNLSAAGVAAGASLGVSIPQSQDSQGKVRLIPVPYTVTGTEANAENIYLCTLRLGAKVLAPLCRIVQQAASTDLFNLKIGDGTDPIRYCNTINCVGAQDVAFSSVTTATDQYAPTAVAAGYQDVVATCVFANAAAGIAAAKILFLIFYEDSAG